MWFSFLVIIIMVAIKAVFSAADTAITYVNPIKVSNLSKKDRKYQKIKYYIEEKNRFYGIIEVVITMIELLSSSYAAEFFVNKLAINVMITTSFSSQVSIIVSIIIVTIVLSYFLLVFGSVLPRQIARNNPEKTIIRLIDIIWIIGKLNIPFEILVRKSTKLFSKIFKIEENPKEHLSENELKMILTEGKNQGVIDKLEKDIAIKALKFENIIAKNIMVKRENIDFIKIDDGKEKILANIKKYKYTRIPVYEKNKDNVIGLLNIKDLIINYSQIEIEKEINIKKYIRPIIFVYENEKISKIFKEMKKDTIQMVIVKNNNEQITGIITMEDILERLVGKIIDEFDEK